MRYRLFKLIPGARQLNDVRCYMYETQIVANVSSVCTCRKVAGHPIKDGVFQVSTSVSVLLLCSFGKHFSI